MDDELRDLLARVAAGTVDPSEAARRLDERDTAHRASGGAALPAPSDPAPDAITRVVVRVAYRGVRLVGDPSVAAVAVDGEHRLSHDGDAVVVSDAVGDWSFTMSRPGGWRALLRQEHRLSVRINPALAVDAELTAGSLTCEGLPRLRRVRLTAGSARISDAAEPLDLVVQAGSAAVSARPTGGRWTLRTESGSLALRLLEGSDARVSGHSSLGKVTVGAEGASSAVVGRGTAEVDIETVMGSASVEVPR